MECIVFSTLWGVSEVKDYRWEIPNPEAVYLKPSCVRKSSIVEGYTVHDCNSLWITEGGFMRRNKSVNKKIDYEILFIG